MNCPYYSQDEYPDVEQCRENRHDNLLSRGKYCRACAKCPRDLGPKPPQAKPKKEKIVIPVVDFDPDAGSSYKKGEKGPHHKRYLSFMGGRESGNFGLELSSAGDRTFPTVKPAPPSKIAPRNDFRQKRYNTHPNSDKLNLPGKDDEKPAKERACPNCKFRITGNRAYCNLCAVAKTTYKDNPERLAQELAHIKHRRDNGLVRIGHGFQPAPKKIGRPKGRNRHNENRKGWPKGLSRREYARDKV